MPSSSNKDFVFALHEASIDNWKSFNTVADENCLKSLAKQVEKCQSDPINAGGGFHIGTVDLYGGSVRKLYIGGRKKYRLIYYVNARLQLVVCLYISEVNRADLDYKSVNCADMVNEIVNDLKNGNSSRFHEVS